MQDWDHHLVIFIAGGLLLVGVLLGLSCIGFTPSMGGKTKIKTDFVDRLPGTIDAETGKVVVGGQDTEYHQSVEAPAGVDLAGLTNMGYDWNPDGSGKVVVSGSGNMSSAKQAEMLPQLATVYAGAFGQAFQASLSMLGPILEQALSAHASLQLWQAQNPRPSGLDSFLSTIQDPAVQAWLTGLIRALPSPSVPAGIIPVKP